MLQLAAKFSYVFTHFHVFSYVFDELIVSLFYFSAICQEFHAISIILFFGVILLNLRRNGICRWSSRNMSSDIRIHFQNTSNDAGVISLATVIIFKASSQNRKRCDAAVVFHFGFVGVCWPSCFSKRWHDFVGGLRKTVDFESLQRTQYLHSGRRAIFNQISQPIRMKRRRFEKRDIDLLGPLVVDLKSVL